MDAATNQCPRCKQNLHAVLAQCYAWTPVETGDSYLVLGTETLFKCHPCAQIYFAEEVADPGVRRAA